MYSTASAVHAEHRRVASSQVASFCYEQLLFEFFQSCPSARARERTLPGAVRSRFGSAASEPKQHQQHGGDELKPGPCVEWVEGRVAVRDGHVWHMFQSQCRGACVHPQSSSAKLS
ncbi:hypothetical protein PGIGA_G00195660 [Pangasianodon gigas]|uniref:Uncharacterized protein n=1 Tax=Pangasianodon gigas TaxID=30993 RepID=A0ACC5XYB9_PANGG|nr:hypothetical protein [Pangasianodon gigas]